MRKVKRDKLACWSAMEDTFLLEIRLFMGLFKVKMRLEVYIVLCF